MIKKLKLKNPRLKNQNQPRLKLKKIKPAKNNSMLVIDIETTGFLGQGGLIVEIGIVSLDIKNGTIVTLFDSICKEPSFNEKHLQHPYGWIFKNSDLTFEQVMNAECINKILPEIQKIINRYEIGCTAFNRLFDVKFLESRGIVFNKLLPCPMLKSAPIVNLPSKYNNPKWPKVEEAWDHFFPDESYTEIHRGADDAFHEAQIIYELIKLNKYWDK